LRDDHPTDRNVKIPSAFRKVAPFLVDAGKPSASAYIIDQSPELGKLENIIGPLRTWQRSFQQKEHLTGIPIGALTS
ncbi:DNA/RNA non-specific endonuclease, partial [Pseudomonas syringae pv. tagetis]